MNLEILNKRLSTYRNARNQVKTQTAYHRLILSHFKHFCARCTSKKFSPINFLDRTSAKRTLSKSNGTSESSALRNFED